MSKISKKVILAIEMNVSYDSDKSFEVGREIYVKKY